MLHGHNQHCEDLAQSRECNLVIEDRTKTWEKKGNIESESIIGDTEGTNQKQLDTKTRPTMYQMIDIVNNMKKEMFIMSKNGS